MLGESQQTFFTVKDLSAQEFIDAFAQYLKKNNLIERPAWADYVKTGTSTTLTIQETSLRLLMMTGSTEELPLLPERSTSGLILESDCSRTSTEDWSEETAPRSRMIMLAPRSSDGVFSSSRNKNILKKTRRETPLKSTPGSSPTMEEEPSTESSLKPSRTENDLNHLFNFLLGAVFRSRDQS